GETIAHGAPVQLIISDGPEPLPVPDVRGQPEDVAKTMVTDARFTLEESQHEFHAEIPQGVVIDALGLDGENLVSLTSLETYGEKQPVTLVVSLGPIPNVSGMTIEEAQQALQDVNLSGIEGRHAFHDSIEAGRVIGVEAAAEGPVREGDTLNLIISDGIEQVEVPDVIDKTWREASQALANAGFDVDFKNGLSEFLSAVPDSSTVKSLEPGPGKKVDKGSTIIVALRAG
ncbi:MAG TPA: PASTA domain-containing protein, partial [Microbacteriaceae bacterium]